MGIFQKWGYKEGIIYNSGHQTIQQGSLNGWYLIASTLLKNSIKLQCHKNKTIHATSITVPLSHVYSRKYEKVWCLRDIYSKLFLLSFIMNFLAIYAIKNLIFYKKLFQQISERFNTNNLWRCEGEWRFRRESKIFLKKEGTNPNRQTHFLFSSRRREGDFKISCGNSSINQEEPQYPYSIQ